MKVIYISATILDEIEVDEPVSADEITEMAYERLENMGVKREIINDLEWDYAEGFFQK